MPPRTKPVPSPAPEAPLAGARLTTFVGLPHAAVLGLAGSLGEASDEVFGEERDVVAPLALRRALMRAGELELEGRILPASNVTLVATATTGAHSLRCIYKPVSGERPLWDFPDGTLHRSPPTSSGTASPLISPTMPPIAESRSTACWATVLPSRAVAVS